MKESDHMKTTMHNKSNLETTIPPVHYISISTEKVYQTQHCNQLTNNTTILRVTKLLNATHHTLSATPQNIRSEQEHPEENTKM
jgi:hypothetical protein